MDRLTKYLDNRTKICIAVCEHECVEGHTVCHKCKPFVDVLVKLASYEDREGQVEYGKWIPCSERLPELNMVEMEAEGEYFMISDSVIVTDGEHMCITQYEIDDEYTKGWLNNCDEEEMEEIVAWQPLPEPYKEG